MLNLAHGEARRAASNYRTLPEKPRRLDLAVIAAILPPAMMMIRNFVSVFLVA
jgi:hypothetical protein